MPLLSGSAFQDLLTTGRTLLSDGAMGSELMGQGIAADAVLSANTSYSGIVRAIHYDYISAGSQVISSNTFGLLPGDGRLDELIAGGRIAIQAARSSSRDVAVWLSIAPAAASKAGILLEAVSTAEPDWTAMLLIETCRTPEEACKALTALQGGRPALMAVTGHFGAHGKMLDGATPEEFFRRATSCGADIVGANCGETPEALIEVARRMRAQTDAPILVQPSAGLPKVVGGNRLAYPVDPAQFARAALGIVEAGANIIGGCCGTSWAHIEAVRATLTEAGHRSRQTAGATADR